MSLPKTYPTSVRLPADLRTWIEARGILTDQSLNAVIVEQLELLRDSDPLTAFRIRDDKGRYVVSSTYSGETFGAFARKDMAEYQAEYVLDLIGADRTNITDETAKEAA